MVRNGPFTKLWRGYAQLLQSAFIYPAPFVYCLIFLLSFYNKWTKGAGFMLYLLKILVPLETAVAFEK